MRGQLTRARIAVLLVAAGAAGMLSTAWLRPVEAQQPPPRRPAAPCADAQQDRTEARQEARAAERALAREKAEGRAGKQQLLDELEEVAAERAIVDADLKRTSERRARLEKAIGGQVIEERSW